MSLAVLLIPLLTGTPGLSRQYTMQDVHERLSSPFHQGLYARTYRSLLERVEPSGFFQESLTGAYSGMFPRTVGALVSLFLETGELECCERLIGCVLQAMQVNDMERVPHVLDRPCTWLQPTGRMGSTLQTEHPIALYRLDQPDRFGGAQEFFAPAQPLQAAELWLSGHHCTGPIRLEVVETLDGPALARCTYPAERLTPAGGWARFEFSPPLELAPGRMYYLRVHHDGEGVPVWWGLAQASERPLGAGRGRDTQIQPGWFDNPGHVTAFALDVGDLGHEVRQATPILCDRDQIDGQAHVIMAWARLALHRGGTPFEDRTYAQVARLTDRSSDWPYLTPYNPGHPMLLADVGLVRNVCFEHSRDGRFWDTFDLLTQSFMCAALTDMIRVADCRGDDAHAARWRGRLRSLEAAIADRMTRELDGQRVYLEMRLPDGGSGTPFEGLGWVNLSPIAAQWEGVNRQVLRNTIAAYRKRALFEWEGQVALALDWWPDRPLDRFVIGKGIGWEMVYSLQESEPERICQWLDLIEAVNAPPLYMEAAAVGADGKWNVGDPGNGEQCAWWCWAVSRLRQAVGMTAAP